MYNIALPLQIEKGRLASVKNLKQSIDAFLSLLIATPKQSCTGNPDFGFIFNNLRFEILSESEGVVFNSSSKDIEQDTDSSGIYDKKISGSSKNLNTFAAELKETISRYEMRLQDISTTMTYVRDERLIYITVKASVRDTNEKYRFNTTIKVWN